MEELYRTIEKKIKDAGYPRAISGEAVYGDICDQIEGKENGSCCFTFPNLRMILSLNIILLLWMKSLISAY